MSILHYIWWFLVALAILIAVHEYGHYLAARLCGVKVLRFSLGFGPRIFARQIGPDRTEWALSAIPLGGYVKMLDEREEAVPPAERHRAFNRQSLGKRSIIVLAGPVANFLLAILIYWGVFLHGSQELAPVVGAVSADSVAARAGLVVGDRIERVAGETIDTASDLRWVIIDHAIDRKRVEVEVSTPRGAREVRQIDLADVKIDDGAPDALAQLGLTVGLPPLPAVVGRTMPGGPAERAGLQPGDRFIEVDGQPVEDWRGFATYIAKRGGQDTRLVIQRGAGRLEMVVQPETVNDQSGSRGRLGVEVQQDPELLQRHLITMRYGVAEGFVRSIEQTAETSIFTLKVMYRMITGVVSLKNVSGPVTIADYAGQTARMGVEHYLRFLALVSISLGVLNLLPVPVLDGGHLLYYVAEFVRGRPLSERVMEAGQRLGLTLLVLLSMLALFNDINRLLPG
ncbi:RIP metalloprotease RseP [Uliginosibacterium sp. H1]|uniref:RIP metalloprotease RseP n=1 Tax=Uliginosibacterium sp. H1 TaxID=3114757 RepID=UPI002E17D949|nr:RIP metalloprotease RseP [Uliginosibacterium sp. H1]